MRRAIIDPIGISAIDLLVCAFIAMVVLNILRQDDDSAPAESVKNAEVYILETDAKCPLGFCLQVGDKQWWPGPGPKTFDVVHLCYNSQKTQVTHRLSTRIPRSAGTVSLLVFAAEAPPETQGASWEVRLSRLSGDHPSMQKVVTLDRGNSFRKTYAPQ